ncbi:MAG: 50S ribosomal protein L19 [Polyangiales bacterium]
MRETAGLPRHSGNVRVHFRIREGDKERVQVVQGVVIEKRAAVPERPSRFAKFRTALASNVFSRSTRRASNKSSHRARSRSSVASVLPPRSARQKARLRSGRRQNAENI